MSLIRSSAVRKKFLLNQNNELLIRLHKDRYFYFPLSLKSLPIMLPPV
uniref:Uncharacterized protein n=1 Tax=Rhizophora mucronata TaxID=61149 RepID=A0A2P2PMI0_RHIMU